MMDVPYAAARAEGRVVAWIDGPWPDKMTQSVFERVKEAALDGGAPLGEDGCERAVCVFLDDGCPCWFRCTIRIVRDCVAVAMQPDTEDAGNDDVRIAVFADDVRVWACPDTLAELGCAPEAATGELTALMPELVVGCRLRGRPLLDLVEQAWRGAPCLADGIEVAGCWNGDGRFDVVIARGAWTARTDAAVAPCPVVVRLVDDAPTDVRPCSRDDLRTLTRVLRRRLRSVAASALRHARQGRVRCLVCVPTYDPLLGVEVLVCAASGPHPLAVVVETSSFDGTVA